MKQLEIAVQIAEIKYPKKLSTICSPSDLILASRSNVGSSTSLSDSRVSSCCSRCSLTCVSLTDLLMNRLTTHVDLTPIATSKMDSNTTAHNSTPQHTTQRRETTVQGLCHLSSLAAFGDRPTDHASHGGRGYMCNVPTPRATPSDVFTRSYSV